jgi:hypothetical protein
MRTLTSPVESSCCKAGFNADVRQADQPSPYVVSLHHLLFQQPEERANAKGKPQISNPHPLVPDTTTYVSFNKERGLGACVSKGRIMFPRMTVPKSQWDVIGQIASSRDLAPSLLYEHRRVLGGKPQRARLDRLRVHGGLSRIA